MIDISNAGVGDLVAEKYELRRLLGEGGMGRVFLARHALTARPVALKLVPVADPVTGERLLREARSMGRLSHPNVVGVLDMGEWAGGVYLAMEYIHGQTLRHFMVTGGVAVEDALRLMLPVCSGIAAAHQAGILHRDLKPENIFVCTDSSGRPFDTKVLDFGVAKALDAPIGLASLTDSGAIVGTPKYMAPEQLGDDAELGHRTDVYALALILYEVLAGRLPYAGDSLRLVVLNILKGDYPALSEVKPSVPTGLSDVIMGALSGDVAGRPSSVAEFARALEPWAGGRGFQAPMDVHTPDPGTDSWRPPAMHLSVSPAQGEEEALARASTVTAKATEGNRTPSQNVTTHRSPISLRSASREAEVASDATRTPNGAELNRASPESGTVRPWFAAAMLVAALVGWGVLQAWPGPNDAGTTAREATAPGPADSDARPLEGDQVHAASGQPMAAPAPVPDAATHDPGSPSAEHTPDGGVAQAALPKPAPPAQGARTPSKSRRKAKRVSARRTPAHGQPRQGAKHSPAQAPAVAPQPQVDYPATDNRDPWAR